jgi:hypothetical protein
MSQVAWPTSFGMECTWILEKDVARPRGRHDKGS